MERLEKDASAGGELAIKSVNAGGISPASSLALSATSPGGAVGATVPGTPSSQLALKDVQCPICLKVFSRKFSLEMHFLIHQGLKPYKCQFCGRCFRQKGTLMRHKAIHSQTPSYRCGLCDKSYRQKNVFLHHLRNRHKVSTDVLDRRRCHIKNSGGSGGGGVIEALPTPNPPSYTSPLPPPSLSSVCLPPLSPPESGEPTIPTLPGGASMPPEPRQGSPQHPIILRISDRQGGMPPTTSVPPALYPAMQGGPLHPLLSSPGGMLASPGSNSYSGDGTIPGQWQCPFCAFESPHDLDVCRNHLLQHVNDAPPVLDCPLCPRRFPSERELGIHLRDFHESSLLMGGAVPPHYRGAGPPPLVGASPPTRAAGGTPIISRVKEEEPRGSDDARSEVTFTCIPCQIEFANEDDFEWHVKTHVQSVLSDSGEDRKPANGTDDAVPLDLASSRRNHERRVQEALRHDEQRFISDSVLRAVNSRQDDEASTLKESGDSKSDRSVSTPVKREGSSPPGKEKGGKRLMCVECGKLFSSKSVYRYHMQLHLSVQGAFRCPLCRMTFQRKHQLLHHTRQRHMKKLRCERCWKQFSYRSLHQRHVQRCMQGPTPQLALRGTLSLPVVDVGAARGALGRDLVGVIPLVASEGDEVNQALGVPVLAPDTLLKSRLNGLLLHVSAGRIGL
ncbi:zinc finger protein 865-like [Ornithodoros turicata]